MQETTLHEKLENLGKLCKGHGNRIVAIRVGVTPQAVRKTWTDRAKNFTDLSPTRQRIVIEALRYSDEVSEVTQKLKQYESNRTPESGERER